MSAPCVDCEKRDECSGLCGEAEEYANQDNVDQKHLLVEQPLEFDNGNNWPSILRPDKALGKMRATYFKCSPMERKVLMLLAVGLNKFEVSKELEITEHFVSQCLSQIAKKAKKL